jgi:hypothetical protein
MNDVNIVAAFINQSSVFGNNFLDLTIIIQSIRKAVEPPADGGHDSQPPDSGQPATPQPPAQQDGGAPMHGAPASGVPTAPKAVPSLPATGAPVGEHVVTTITRTVEETPMIWLAGIVLVIAGLAVRRSPLAAAA